MLVTSLLLLSTRTLRVKLSSKSDTVTVMLRSCVRCDAKSERHFRARQVSCIQNIDRLLRQVRQRELQRWRTWVVRKAPRPLRALFTHLPIGLAQSRLFCAIYEQSMYDVISTDSALGGSICPDSPIQYRIPYPKQEKDCWKNAWYY